MPGQRQHVRPARRAGTRGRRAPARAPPRRGGGRGPRGAARAPAGQPVRATLVERLGHARDVGALFSRAASDQVEDRPPPPPSLVADARGEVVDVRACAGRRRRPCPARAAASRAEHATCAGSARSRLRFRGTPSTRSGELGVARAVPPDEGRRARPSGAGTPPGPRHLARAHVGAAAAAELGAAAVRRGVRARLVEQRALAVRREQQPRELRVGLGRACATARRRAGAARAAPRRRAAELVARPRSTPSSGASPPSSPPPPAPPGAPPPERPAIAAASAAPPAGSSSPSATSPRSARAGDALLRQSCELGREPVAQEERVHRLGLEVREQLLERVVRARRLVRVEAGRLDERARAAARASRGRQAGAVERGAARRADRESAVRDVLDDGRVQRARERVARAARHRRTASASGGETPRAPARRARRARPRAASGGAVAVEAEQARGVVARARARRAPCTRPRRRP